MANLKKSLPDLCRLYKLYKYLCFTVLLFCVCVNTPDHCSDGNLYDSATQFCYAGEALDKCGGREYDFDTQKCDKGEIREREDICGGNKYDAAIQECVNGTIREKEDICVDGNYVLSGDSCGVVDTLTIFTVRFDTDGGIPGTISPVSVDSGKTAGTDFPEDPAKTGYTFDGWYDEDTLYDSSTVIIKDVTLTAKFEINSYTLITAALPAEGGSVTRDPDLESYDYGTEVTVTAVKAEGYTFAGWNGASTSIINTKIIITMDGDKELAALFEIIPVNYYTLDIKTDPLKGGDVSREPEAASYAAGTPVTVTAEAAEDYEFASWSGASNSKNRSVTVTMNANTTLTANFEVKEYNVKVSVIGDGAEVTTPLNFVVKSGQDSVVRFSLANKDAVLDRIVVNGKQVVNPDLGVSGSAPWNEPRSFKLDKIRSDLDVIVYARIPLYVSFYASGLITLKEGPASVNTFSSFGGESCDHWAKLYFATNKKILKKTEWKFVYPDEDTLTGSMSDSQRLTQCGSSSDLYEEMYVMSLPVKWISLPYEYPMKSRYIYALQKVMFKFVDEAGQVIEGTADFSWKEVSMREGDRYDHCYTGGYDIVNSIVESLWDKTISEFHPVE